MAKSPRSPRAIVDHQVQRWSEEHQKRTKWGKKLPPVITMSRQYGAPGAAIARAVAEKLGWSCWDQEILHEIAQHAQAPEVLFSSLDERRRDAITEMIGVFGSENKVTASSYLKELLRVLHTIAQHGEAIIVGRGAQYVLNPSSTLRVRIIAELEDRVEGLAVKRRISLEEARQAAIHVDAERQDFIRYHYNRDIEEPIGYDLIINSSGFGFEQAVELVVAAHRQRFGG